MADTEHLSNPLFPKAIPDKVVSVFYFVIGFIIGFAFIDVTFFSTFLSSYRIGTMFVDIALFGGILIVILYRLFYTKRLLFYPQTILCYILLALFCLTVLLVDWYNFPYFHSEDRYISALYRVLIYLEIPLFFILTNPKSLLPLLKGLGFFYFVIIAGYIITFVIFNENGMYNMDAPRKHFLFGHINHSIKILLPGMAIWGIIDLWEHNKIRIHTWIFYAIIFLSLIWERSYIGIIGTVIFLTLLIILSIKPKIADRIPKLSPLFVSLLIFLIIFIISLLPLSSFFENLTSSINREDSITTRLNLVNQGIAYFLQNPMGYGYDLNFRLLLHNDPTFGHLTAHNIFVDIMIISGIIGLVFFLVFLFFTLRKTASWSKWIIIPSVLFSYAFMWDFEQYLNPPGLEGILILLFIFMVLPNENVAALKEKADK